MKRGGWMALGIVLAGALAMTAGFVAAGRWLPGKSGDATLSGEQPVPALAFTDLTGQAGNLSQWRGKLLLVNFWASWCAPCVDEIPLLVEAQARYGARGLQIVGPAFDEPEPVWKMVRRLRINYPVSADLNQADASARALGNGGGALPYSVLISRDGHVLKTVLGGFTPEQLDALLQEHL